MAAGLFLVSILPPSLPEEVIFLMSFLKKEEMFNDNSNRIKR